MRRRTLIDLLATGGAFVPLRRPLEMLLFLTIVLGAPRVARADGLIWFMIFAPQVGGLALLLALLVVLAEALVLARGFHFPYRRGLKIAVLANVASLVAGAFFVEVTHQIVNACYPHQLGPHFAFYTQLRWLEIGTHFIGSLAVELAVVLWWRRHARACVGVARMVVLVLLANVVTYAVLTPLHFLWTRPAPHPWQFTDDAHWARTPLTTIYYLDPDGRLCTIRSDGSDRQVIIPEFIHDYQLMPDAGQILFRDRANRVCLWQEQAAAVVCRWAPPRPYGMGQLACAPDGRQIALVYWARDAYVAELFTYDCETQQLHVRGISTAGPVEAHLTPSEWPRKPEVAWNGNTIQVKLDKELVTVEVAATDHEAACAQSVPVYGGFAVDDMRSFRTDDVFTFRGKTGTVLMVLRQWDERPLPMWPYVGSDPLFSPLPRYGGIAPLPDGDEIVFDYWGYLYLLDYRTLQVGPITPGRQFALLTDRYRRELDDNKRSPVIKWW